MGISLTEYYRYKKGLKESLAAKSREQMKRRHSFFNMENETIKEHEPSDDEEEEENLSVFVKHQDSTTEHCSVHTDEADISNQEEEEEEADDVLINKELQTFQTDGEIDSQIEVVESGQMEKSEECSESPSLLFSRSSSSVSSIQNCLDNDQTFNSLIAHTQVLEPELGFSSDLPANEEKSFRASQDFNEALTLCSGTFGSDTSATPTSVDVNFFSNNDLYTVDDDRSSCKAAVEDFVSLNENELQELSPKSKTNFKVYDLYDDEALLNEGENASDDEYDGKDIGEYEEEENDEKLPADHLIIEDLSRQYVKQKNDEEERRLMILMDRYLPDGELHTEKNVDRSFRFRMRSDRDVDWSKVLGSADVGFQAEDEDEEEAQAAQVRERKIEMMKWRIEQEKQRNDTQGSSTIQVVSDCSISYSLLKFGENIAKRQKMVTLSDTDMNQLEDVEATVPQSVLLDSLLRKANAFRPLFNEDLSTRTKEKLADKTFNRVLFLSDDATKGIARRFAK